MIIRTALRSRYKSRLTLQQLRSSPLYAPQLHAAPSPDAHNNESQLAKLKEVTAKLQAALDDGRAPTLEQVVGILRSVQYK